MVESNDVWISVLVRVIWLLALLRGELVQAGGGPGVGVRPGRGRGRGAGEGRERPTEAGITKGANTTYVTPQLG